jgi:RNA polymerase sigma-70 factor (ECF subfamily)
VNDVDDLALVAAARSGDRAALEALLLRHHPKVLGLCRRLLTDARDAEDAAQEALLAVCRGLDRFDERSAFTTWLYRITTNTCLDELRRRRRRPATAPDDPADDATAGGSMHRSIDPAVVVTARVDVDRALAQLPVEYRVAVVLRDGCDLDYAEIARLTGVPDGTVRSRIARGRAALARLLAADPAPTGNPAAASNVEGTDHG